MTTSKNTRLAIVALFVIIMNAITIALAYLTKSNAPDDSLTECAQKTRSVELCASAYR